ncbi:sensor histidine kinase [Roseivivax sediminis]|uniref:histidine kinase n=1 Tax=Roseivivax sediminis TaxID=936889 RepID=A0A1I2D9Z1_9RHOB|nr:PAS domain-containing sensor histidine kinase [Roseivivax sediminis]SFE77346.1 two-component system, NtrC family, nitrogen regulation sensor histidine kinase NtrY [Roseivivax sediminis]
MATRARGIDWSRIDRLRRQRRVQNAATLGLVLLGPILAVITYMVLGPLDRGSADTTTLRLVLLADLVYIILIAGLVLSRVAALIAARRAQSAGSRLHLRLTGVFALMALLPTITVAVFGVLTINAGLETWFSTRVQNVVGASLEAAEAYEEEHRADLQADAQELAAFLDANRRAAPLLTDGLLRDMLASGQLQIQRGLSEAFVIDGVGEIHARGEGSYRFYYEQPGQIDFAEADANGITLIPDWDNDELRALVPLPAFVDRYLYVTRTVDGDILNLLDDTQETARFYQQQESERGRRLFDFALLYLGFAVLLILAAVWLGLWFAERLSRPVGRLTGAAQRVGAGDLDVQVKEDTGDDEIAMLGRYFNQMTRQLKRQRERLLENTRQIERRQRLFDSVLTSVTSGVAGLDAEGRVAFVNRSAERLLDWQEENQSLPIHVAVPEFGALFDRLQSTGAEVVQEEVKVSREGRLEHLLVRMSTRRREDRSLEGYVVAFDDVTDLVSAQRLAAWGDVARRIAHEIKNPLTPIQLSAERIKRRYRRGLEEDEAARLDQMTDVIVRQTNDLRRIVDEFSKFARMPEPERKDEDLTGLLRGAVLLQETGQPGVRFDIDLPDIELRASLDATMISQALTNLMKNAGEAIESLQEKGAPEGHVPTIGVTLTPGGGFAEIRIIDNGIGLPEDRARLFEPYVTTRDKGTGLGLPIVKKIIEEHGGTLSLEDAPAPEGWAGHRGAMAVVRLPVADAPPQEAARAAETV